MIRDRTDVAPTTVAVAPGSSVKAPAHLPALDGVRGLAIALVMTRHLSLEGMLRESTHPLDRLVASVGSVGWVGVDLFFVLSGFLITGVLLGERERVAPAAGKFGRFYWRRMLRILPLYYAACAVLFFVVPHLPYYRDQPEIVTLQQFQAWYWLHGVNLLTLFHGMNALTFNTGHFWSLAVEEQFYLVWPFVVLTVNRRTLWKVVAAMVILAPLVRLICLLGAGGANAAATLSISRMDVLGFGALLALVYRTDSARQRSVRVIPWAVAFAAGALAILAGTVGLGESQGTAVLLVGYTAVAVLMAALIATSIGLRAFPVPGRVLERWLTTRGLRSLGKYSYCLYIVHYPLMGPLELIWTRVRIPAVGGSHLPEWFLFSTVLVAMSWAVAAVSWRWLEAPMLSLKDRWPFTRSLGARPDHHVERPPPEGAGDAHDGAPDRRHVPGDR